MQEIEGFSDSLRGVHFQGQEGAVSPFFSVRSGCTGGGVQRQNAEKCRKYGLSEGVQKY